MKSTRVAVANVHETTFFQSCQIKPLAVHVGHTRGCHKVLIFGFLYTSLVWLENCIPCPIFCMIVAHIIYMFVEQCVKEPSLISYHCNYYIGALQNHACKVMPDYFGRPNSSNLA